MKKDHFIPVFFVVVALLVSPRHSFAQCETPATANAALQDMATGQVAAVNKFIADQRDYIDEVIRTTSISETVGRMDSFSADLTTWLNDWWEKGLHLALKSQIEQWNIAHLDQALSLGRMQDANILLEEQRLHAENLIDARKRYGTSDRACEIDTVAPARARAFNLSYALNRGIINDDLPRRSNALNTISATGKGPEKAALWDEYIRQFCDGSLGEQACTGDGRPQPGAFPGMNKDLPSMLWGNKQTIDMSNPDNVMIMRATLRNLVNPFSPEPIVGKMVNSPDGRIMRMFRQSDTAYTNTIYNTFGQMLSERAGGSGVNTQVMRAAAGIPASDASTDASYRELQEMMIKDRARDPATLIKLIDNPNQSLRETIFSNALRLQTMNDIYRRSEELLFMEAATLSRDVYRGIPGTAASSVPVRGN